MKRLLALIALAVLVGACEKFDLYDCDSTDNPVTSTISSEKGEQVAASICNSLNANELIGIQVSIRDSLNEDWSVSLGATDVEQTTDLENEHILRVGSVTKIFTATLILKLIEQNDLLLDQKLIDFFPEQDQVRDVTIRNLLNHSSGIADVFSIPSIFISSTNFPDKQWNPAYVAEVCMEKGLDFSPGSQHAYSNTNYIILGLIAEKATGEKIDRLFAELITEPLGLNNTYLVPYMDTPPELVNGYVHHFAGSLTEWYVNEPENTSWATVGFTAGSVASTATDLSAFTYHLFHGDIIGEESLELMTDFSGNNGLGLFRIRVNDRNYWGHEGEITGFESITVYEPDSRVVISICCNTTPFKIKELLNEIDAIL
jgi:CubicO group peptidase (beta-lactamase class C family)